MDSPDEGGAHTGGDPADHDPYGGLLPPSGPTTDAAPTPPAPAHRSVRTRVLTGAAAVVVAVAGFFGIKALTSHDNSASATSPPGAAQGQGGPGRGFPGGGGVAGTLSSVDGSTLTVKDRNGATTKVVTSSSTTFTKVVTGSVGDIKVGDRIVATGAAGASGSAGGADAFTASRITDSGTGANLPGFGGGGRRNGTGTGDGNQVTAPGGTGPGGNRPAAGSFVAGTVKSIQGATLTVTRADGTTTTAATGSDTTVSLVRPSSPGDLKVGQQVRVSGKAAADGTVTANSVTEGSAGFGPRAGRPAGAGGTGGNQPS